MLKPLVVFTALVTATFGQALDFEAASLKPADRDETASGVVRSPSPGRIGYHNMTLRALLYEAYGTGLSTSLSVFGGPAWINRDRYTIEAVAPDAMSREHYRVVDHDNWVYRMDASNDAGRTWNEGKIEMTFSRSE